MVPLRPDVLVFDVVALRAVVRVPTVFFAATFVGSSFFVRVACFTLRAPLALVVGVFVFEAFALVGEAVLRDCREVLVRRVLVVADAARFVEVLVFAGAVGVVFVSVFLVDLVAKFRSPGI